MPNSSSSTFSVRVQVPNNCMAGMDFGDSSCSAALGEACDHWVLEPLGFCAF